jgi:hypothetical protein
VVSGSSSNVNANRQSVGAVQQRNKSRWLLDLVGYDSFMPGVRGQDMFKLKQSMGQI